MGIDPRGSFLLVGAGSISRAAYPLDDETFGRPGLSCNIPPPQPSRAEPKQARAAPSLPRLGAGFAPLLVLARNGAGSYFQGSYSIIYSEFARAISKFVDTLKLDRLADTANCLLSFRRDI
ncbi:hypothetical protein NL676_018404 [Syzygium grande]|nr:hypothetical protein NL676_018404 [Syzygium grande]